MQEITIDEMIEYIKSLINDFKKISKIKPTKLRAILASLKELKYIKQRIVSIQTICEGVNERLKQKKGKCNCTNSTGNITITVCNCCGKPIKSEHFIGKIEWVEGSRTMEGDK